MPPREFTDRRGIGVMGENEIVRWIGVGLGIAFIGVILFRIRDEEALMQQAFGEAWAHYCEHSWRLVPFIY